MHLESHPIEIYQLRIWLKYISPMIWRRLLVKSSDKLSDLYHYIQIAMGWEGIHLHQFIIRGITADEEKILGDFHFHANERFIYEYDFFAHWEHEVRIEKKFSAHKNTFYPLCTGGNRMAPPEDCGGSSRFLSLEDYYKPFNMMFTLIEAVEECESGEREEEELDEIISQFKEWQSRPTFNRETINNQLQQYAYR